MTLEDWVWQSSKVFWIWSNFTQSLPKIHVVEDHMKIFEGFLALKGFVTSAIPVQCSTNWATKPHIGSKVNLLSSGVLSIRPNIPVWNSGYSIRQMEQYFPVRWINPSQVIRFQVSFENTKSNRGLFYLSILALGLLDDSEVEINDILGESDNITFIVRIWKESTTISLMSTRVSFKYERAVHSSDSAHISHSSHVFSQYSLNLLEVNPLQ